MSDERWERGNGNAPAPKGPLGGLLDELMVEQAALRERARDRRRAADDADVALERKTAQVEHLRDVVWKGLLARDSAAEPAAAPPAEPSKPEPVPAGVAVPESFLERARGAQAAPPPPPPPEDPPEDPRPRKTEVPFDAPLSKLVLHDMLHSGKAWMRASEVQELISLSRPTAVRSVPALLSKLCNDGELVKRPVPGEVGTVQYALPQSVSAAARASRQPREVP